jgi:hypothetical protein
MRFGIVISVAALAVLATTSVGYTQSNQSSSTPPANRKDKAPETFWPTPAEEADIPYHPCTIAIGWENRRLVCRNY